MYQCCDQGLSREQIKAAIQDYPILQQLAEILVTQKWNEANQALLSYKRVKDELSVHNGYILHGNRIVVPMKLQARAITIAHSSHQGIIARDPNMVSWN